MILCQIIPPVRGFKYSIKDTEYAHYKDRYGPIDIKYIPVTYCQIILRQDALVYPGSQM